MTIDPILLLEIVLTIIMIISAIIAVETKHLVAALAMLGLVSLQASVYFLILQAPDVAMTEASIGAGLSVGIFAYAFWKTGETEEKLENLEEMDKGVLIK